MLKDIKADGLEVRKMGNSLFAAHSAVFHSLWICIRMILESSSNSICLELTKTIETIEISNARGLPRFEIFVLRTFKRFTTIKTLEIFKVFRISTRDLPTSSFPIVRIRTRSDAIRTDSKRCKVSQIPSLSFVDRQPSFNHVFHGGSLRNKRWFRAAIILWGHFSVPLTSPAPALSTFVVPSSCLWPSLAIRDYYERRNTNSPKGSTMKRGRGQLTQSHFAANDSRMLLRVGYGRYGYHPVEHRSPEVRAWKNKREKKERKRKKTNENNQQ